MRSRTVAVASWVVLGLLAGACGGGGSGGTRGAPSFAIPSVGGGSVAWLPVSDTYVVSQDVPYAAAGNVFALVDGIVWRSFLRFDIRYLAGVDVTRATLHLTQVGVDGDPYALLGPLLVDEVDLGAVLDETDFDGPVVTPLGVLTTSPSLGRRQRDVTGAFQAALLAGRDAFDVRLGFQEVLPDPWPDEAQARFASEWFAGDATLRPYLVVEHQP